MKRWSAVYRLYWISCAWRVVQRWDILSNFCLICTVQYGAFGKFYEEFDNELLSMIIFGFRPINFTTCSTALKWNTGLGITQGSLVQSFSS